jgi:mannose-6-phosphate isomerase
VNNVAWLKGVIQPYAWGSTTLLADLLGHPNTGKPEAELWLGAHPSAPSRMLGPSARDLGCLSDAIESDLAGTLGMRCVEAFGETLPFLLKVLAAAEPLSLQTHPNEAQARAGFALENERGVAPSAPQRMYKDPRHKPELICALTPFRALCGFRPMSESCALASDMVLPELSKFLPALQKEADQGQSQSPTLVLLMQALLSASIADQTALVARVCAALKQSARWTVEEALATELAERYPSDAGVLIALFMNQVTLSPGEALYLPAGNLHAYIEGLGIELMANSDNVLRGGLTPKHVDVAELARVLVPNCGRARPVLREPVAAAHEIVRYVTAATEFELQRHLWSATGAGAYAWKADGPEIWFLTEGALELQGSLGAITLAKGQAAFVPAGLEVSASSSTYTVAYRALVPC